MLKSSKFLSAANGGVSENNSLPGSYSRYRSMKKTYCRRKGRVRNNMEKKQDNREEDKVGKETRALQVPCRSETYGYNGENSR